MGQLLKLSSKCEDHVFILFYFHYISIKHICSAHVVACWVNTLADQFLLFLLVKFINSAVIIKNINVWCTFYWKKVSASYFGYLPSIYVFKFQSIFHFFLIPVRFLFRIKVNLSKQKLCHVKSCFSNRQHVGCFSKRSKWQIFVCKKSKELFIFRFPICQDEKLYTFFQTGGQ